MEISPELKDTIKTFLSLVMGQDEAQRFANLGEALALIKQEQPCWQAPVSIGVHARILHSAGAYEALLQDLIGHALEPLEALLKSLVAKTGEKSSAAELARLLFHTRFGLGFLLLASGDGKQAKTILHEMASTQLSVRGAESRSGPGIVRQTPDIVAGKLLAFLFTQKEDCREALYLATEAIACFFGAPGRELIFKPASDLVDLWVTECENEDASREYDFPTWNWVDLFAEVAEILSVCQEVDSTGVLPNDCEVESAQFWAWKLGQIAARLAVHGRWRENPFDMALNVLRSDFWEFESSTFLRGTDKAFEALSAVGSLLCEYSPSHDWQKTRQRYVSMWEESYTCRGVSSPEITPEKDLYWAMRIGFAAKILESAQQGASVQVPTEPPPIIRDIESTKDIVTTIALRQMKEQRSLDEILQRLLPSQKEIRQFIEQQLRTVSREVPAKVVNTLTKAEKYYRSEVNDDDAKVWFHKAVEASLDCCLVMPLVEFMQKRGRQQVAVCFPTPRGVEYKSPTALRKLSLPEWADVFEMVAAPPHKGLATLGVDDLRGFMGEHFGGPRLPDLRPLSRSLRIVPQLRKGSAHYEEATSRYEKERWELEKMRSIVLGIGEDSVIVQVFQFLAPR